MARGGVSPVPVTLPVVSFSKVEDDFSSKHQSIPEQSIRAYGYNDGSSFQRPEHYTRYIEPLESELAVQVEYDMDEQDQCWLDALNIERRAKNLGSVPYEVFEIVMDRLEKEWFDLTKNIPKPDLAMPSEDSTCAICDDSEGENTNAIVFCDGCNLAVHQDCYGVPYIPEGQWLCRKCTVSPENPVSCTLCPNEGGAFKQASSGEWVHLLCAIWVPETRVGNDVFMEPVTGLDKISKQRWKLKCSICDVREGACIQCIKSSCFLAFHATCARKEKLLMPMKSSQGSEAPTLACYCEKHLPREQAEARATALAAERLEGAIHNDNDPQAVKSARAYAKTYKPGPPLVPQIIVRRIEQYIQRIHLRHKHEFIILACKYWSLKREARRGAPLLKRLHLEPWTASVGGRNQSDEDKVIKLEHAKRVRQDLETLKNFVVACRRREGRKLQQQTVIQNILSQFLLKKQPLLRMAFEDIMAQDKSSYFKDPVSKVDVPDYYDIIKNPICWNTIDRKLDQYEYWDLESLKADIRLVLSNAMIYNKADTPYWRTAQRIKNSSEIIFAKLDKRINPHDILPPTDNEPHEASSSIPSEQLPPPATTSAIGDIEPPLEFLELLLAQESIENERNMKYILEKTPIEALFSFELGTLKPAPPSPPSPPSPSSPLPPLTATTAGKPKRDRKAEKERRRRHSQPDTSPEFRTTAPPRTRRAVAAFAAFEAEASGLPDQEHEQVESLDPVAPAVEVAMVVDGDVPVAEPVAVPEHEPEPGPEPEPEPEDAPVIIVPSKRKHKRSPITLPGQSEVPPVVDSVDNQQSFKMFDAGWILPDDHRRGGRAPVERQPLPEPKKKKSRTEREKSHLSIATTSPVHNDTLLPLSASAGSTEPGASFSPQAPLAELPAEQMVVDEEHAQVREQEEVVIMASPVQLLAEEHSMESLDAEPAAASATDEPVLSEVTPVPVPESAPVTAEIDPESHPQPAQTAREDTEAVQAEEEEEEEEDDGPPRIIIIEELDTPATRREKNMRKKAERQRLAAEAAAAAAALLEIEAQAMTATPDVAHEEDGDGREMDVGEDAEMGSQSDLTSLGSTNGEAEEDVRTDMDMDAAGVLSGSLTPVEGLLSEAGDDRDGDGDINMSGLPPRESPSMTPLPPSESPQGSLSELPTMSPLPSPSEPPSMSPVTPSRKQQSKTKKQRLKDEMERGKLRLARGKFLEGGTLVWAKLKTYPWWPAVVFEPDDPLVAQEGVPMRPAASIKKDQLHLVRFYDNKDYWEWVPPDKMMLLGEDNDLDAEMMASSSTIQKWKNSRARDSLRKSYRRAQAEMETGDADDADASNA